MSNFGGFSWKTPKNFDMVYPGETVSTFKVFGGKTLESCTCIVLPVQQKNKLLGGEPSLVGDLCFLEQIP